MAEPIQASEQAELSVADREKVVSGAINDVSHIATLPEVTVRIVELVEDPDSTAQDLKHLIANDPAMTARVLKVVNSAFYALPGQVGSIDRAIVLLGLNAVKNIAIAASLAKLFRGGRLCPDFSAQDLWRHSITVASAVKLLADRTQLGISEEAFLAGLMHDIGIMVEIQARRPKLIKALEAMKGGGLTFRQAEKAVFGVTHEHFGQAMCDRWKFPPSLGQVAGYHHRPTSLNTEARALTTLVHIGDILAARSGIGYGRTVDSNDVRTSLLNELKLSESAIDEVEEQLPAAAEVADSLLN